MRTVAPPLQLATLAEDPNLARIGIPRALSRELSKTAKAVRAVQFRTNHNLTGKGILVAVIDGEVDATHPALVGRVLQKKNFTKESWGHPDGHGTGVAGIIASARKTLMGMAPAATIASYKVFATNPADHGSEFDATLAIQQALEDGAMIANCSWGVGLATNPDSRETRACNRAWDLGLVLIKSAGNGGPGKGTLTSPANARGIIVVGATDRTGKTLENYSSRGPVPGKGGPDFLRPAALCSMVCSVSFLAERPEALGPGPASPHLTWWG
ncbi:MAG: S8 family serine peptidase [Bryobacteraceae bacterium]|nr:S8 family serine peptidase [Bryobacteraceae bacterium]